MTVSNKPLDVTNCFFSKEWMEILDEITFFAKMSRDVWYRGQNNNESKEFPYRLISGLFRLNLSIEEILDWEEISYKRFRENGYDLHKTENEWDVLYLMQQYGVKTRLLDWSESFAIALYFATKSWNGQNDCSIWLLDPYRLNQTFHGSYELKSMQREVSFLETRQDISKTMALSPNTNTYRSMSQKGYFTIQGNSKCSLEEEEDQILFKHKALKHIRISPNLKNDVEMFLELSGINHFTLFPDLDGLAKFINDWTTEDVHKKNTNKLKEITESNMIRKKEDGYQSWKEDEHTYE